MSNAAAGIDRSPGAGVAAVVGASGGIGAALLAQLRADPRHRAVLALGRRSKIELDLLDESSIVSAADQVDAAAREAAAPLRLLIDATGVLQGDGVVAEKRWQDIDPAAMARAFAVNAIGPALLMKHFGPRLPRQGRAVFVTLSARVGSIGDNRLGGWPSYRASKAALNQLVRCAAIEWRRSRPGAICVALHPGTVDTALSRPFAKAGLAVQTPADAAQRLLAVIDGLTPADSGGFFSYSGEALPW